MRALWRPQTFCNLLSFLPSLYIKQSVEPVLSIAAANRQYRATWILRGKLSRIENRAVGSLVRSLKSPLDRAAL